MEKYGQIYEYYIHLSRSPLSIVPYWEGFVYKIYLQETKELALESNEWFDSEEQASIAAMDSINLLEKGVLND